MSPMRGSAKGKDIRLYPAYTAPALGTPLALLGFAGPFVEAGLQFRLSTGWSVSLCAFAFTGADLSVAFTQRRLAIHRSLLMDGTFTECGQEVC